MKKGLLTILAASLVFVGCQNYDDQFDDLNAQISALKSQVDGLSSLSGQVASLSGSISGLQAGVSAAQAAASSAASSASAAATQADANASAIAAATAAATAAGASADAATAAAQAATAAATSAGSTATTNATDLDALAASLTALAADVTAVQASLATAATADAVTALQAEIKDIEKDLDDLLASSNIYSTDVTVTNATTLNSALALGNKINVLNATLTITGWSGMDYAGVQTLVDRVITATGNIVYRAYSATGTEVVFNNLVSAGDITVRQPGGYSFPKLANAKKIDLENNFTSTVTNISFPALTTATSIETSDTGTFTVNFPSATNVDFGAMVTAPSNVIAITTKKDATLNLSKWKSTDANGNTQNATLTLNGPASFTNGTAAGTFASTGLAGNTLGAVDGTLSFTNVATVAVHNFRGAIELETGVKTFTGNNIVSVGTSGNPLTDAVSLETVNITMIRDNDPGNLSDVTTANNKSATTNNGDLLFTSAHAKLTSATITGKTGHVKFTSLPALTTVDLTGADAFDVYASGNAALTSWTDASKAEDRIFDNNDSMTSVTLSATTKLTATNDKAVSVSVDDNAEMTSLTISMDDVETLSITDNPKLATLAATGLKDNGTSTSADASVYANAFVASLVKNTFETTATRNATGWAVGGSTDAGTITTDSGLKTLSTWADDAIGATTGTVSIWFDTITKLETQSEYGGAFTDETDQLTAVSNPPTKAQASASTYTGYYAYVYADKLVPAGASTGVRSNELVTYTFDIKREGTAQTDVALPTSEGLQVVLGGATYTFDGGDTYNGSTVTSVSQLVQYLDAANYSGVGDVIAAQDGYEKTLVNVSYVNSTGGAAVEGVVSTSGLLYLDMGTDLETQTTKYLVANLTAGDTQSAVAEEIRRVVNQDSDFSTTTVSSNQFYIVRNVSGNLGSDTSPLAVNVSITPVIDASGASSTVGLIPSGYDDGDGVGVGGTVSNTDGITSGLFSFAVTETLKKGIRVTLKNTGSLAFASGTGVKITATSNTAIIGDPLFGGTSALTQGLLVAGVNITTYVEDTNEAPGSYVTAFTEIDATGTAGTALIAATVNNKLGW